MDTLNIPSWQPTFGSIEDWNKAFIEMDRYLIAHSLSSAVQRAKIAYGILQKIALEGDVSSGSIITRAMEELIKQRNAWVRKLAGINEEPSFADAHYCIWLIFQINGNTHLW